MPRPKKSGQKEPSAPATDLAQVPVEDLIDELRHRVHPIYIGADPKDQNLVVHFPRNRMRLGEIMDVIEQQTPFRRMIARCANESTILWGSCVTTISMSPPPRPAEDYGPGRLVVQAPGAAGDTTPQSAPSAAVEGSR